MTARLHVERLHVPFRLAAELPAVYLEEDALAQRLLDALDEVLAPIWMVIDNFDAYLDPHLAPDDFVPWLAGWVGLAIDENWDDARLRAFVRRAEELFAWRGTRRGIKELVEVYAGATPEIVETGGWTDGDGPDRSCISADDADAVPRRRPGPVRVLVRVTPQDRAGFDGARLDRLLRAAAPAHVPVSLELAAR